MSHPGPDAHWFPVGALKRRRAKISCVVLGSFSGFVALSCLGYGALGEGINLAWRIPFLAGAGIVFLLRRVMHDAGAPDAALGVDRAGVWWHESGATVGFGWRELSGARIHRVRRVTGRSRYYSWHVELIPHAPRRTGEPLRDRFLVHDRYWIGLPDTVAAVGMVRVAEGTADLVAGAIQGVRPDLWRGVVHTPPR